MNRTDEAMKCLQCNQTARMRGLCSWCYRKARVAINADHREDERMVAAGLLLPSKKRGKKCISLRGEVCGNWTLVENTSGGRCIARCVCGTEKEIKSDGFRKGKPHSCGCVRLPAKTKHGMSKSREYAIWVGMKQRCDDPKDKMFCYYGGRGIKVCERWHDSFENFYADMGPRPSPRHSVDRVDVDGPYSPENCRWATPLEQGRNRRNSQLFEVDGEQLCVSEIAERSGIAPGTLYGRLVTRQWGVQRATNQPVQKRKKICAGPT